MQERTRLEKQLDEVRQLGRDLDDALMLIELGEAEGDAATVYGIIVDGDGTGATQLLSDPDAELIVPCDPQNSYLYRKLLG